MLSDGVIGVIARDEASAASLAALLEQAGARVETGLCGVSDLAVLANPGLDAVVLDVGDEPERFAALGSARASDERARRAPAVARVAPSLSVAAVADLGASLVLGDADSELVARLETLVARGRAERQDQRTSRELRAELRRAGEAWAALERALAAATHDVLAMCGVVVGYGANLRDEIVGPLLPQQRQHAESMIEAAGDIARLLERVAAGVREQSGRRRSDPPPSSRRTPDRRALHDVAALVRASAELLANAAEQRGISMTVVARESPRVWCDALEVRQVVTNLVSNALKFTPAGGRVTVEVGTATGAGEARRTLRILVRDSGPGVPVEDRERVFERGRRLARDARVAGSGLGLSVVKDIVTGHGGSVRIDDAEGGGAAFVVTLPIDRRARAEPAVLLVDDPAGARRIAAALVSRGAESARVARDDALAEAARGCAALVVVPRGSLPELASALRKEGA